MFRIHSSIFWPSSRLTKRHKYVEGFKQDDRLTVFQRPHSHFPRSIRGDARKVEAHGERGKQ